MMHIFALITLIFFNKNYCKCEELTNRTVLDTLLKQIQDIDKSVGEHQDRSDPDSSNLSSCIVKIVDKYFREEKSVTFVDMNFNDEDILKTLNLLNIISIVNRNSIVKFKFINQKYVLMVDNLHTFTESFPNLTKEAGWNPLAHFLIVFQSLETHEFEVVLNMLLRYHVINILIIHGTSNPYLYTYNPFENYACGKYYKRIINLGICSNNTNELYPEKLVTGLRNCSFNISAPHWPPFSIDPAKKEEGMTSLGVEQYVMEIIAEIENFKINFAYNFDPEKFSIVTSDMSVSGPMEMLQNNKTDIMLGGLLLYRARARAFGYVYGHLDHTDDIKVVVKKAPKLEAWELFYMEFEPTVWLCLFLSLVVFAMLLIILTQAQDRIKVVLKLLDSLLLHGYRIRSRLIVKCIFVFWLWFTFLINCFYQSNLMSLTTTSASAKQISNPNDLVTYNVNPCVSPIMFKFIDKYRNKSDSVYSLRSLPRCKTLLESLRTVSNSKYFYTITLNSIYLYNKHLFYDQFGQPRLYSFPRPISNAVYAIYFYKGFPMQHRINMLTLILKENGLIQRHLEQLHYLKNLQYHYQYKEFEVRFVIPWYLYGFGCFISIVAFVIECSSKM